jgi:hypothetical protein
LDLVEVSRPCFAAVRQGEHENVFWYPVDGHPDGPNPNPYFRVDNAYAYATEFNPHPGDPVLPWFAITGQFVFPAEGHARGESLRPWYTILGSLLYPTAHHAAGESNAPWYQQRR